MSCLYGSVRGLRRLEEIREEMINNTLTERCELLIYGNDHNLCRLTGKLVSQSQCVNYKKCKDYNQRMGELA